jgi:cytochrome d ubiquinol oxidase subunit I
MVRVQPMKMASVEALWESADPASFSLFTWGDQANLDDRFSIRIPSILSILAYNQPAGMVKGIRNLQAEYEQMYGPGYYVPSVFTTYWTFRIMVGCGFLMLALMAVALYHNLKNKPFEKSRFLAILPFTIALPYIANTTGWLLTEMGRQPWVVFGVMKTEQAFSPNLTPGMVLTTLIVFTLVYGALMVADVFLMLKTVKAGPAPAADGEHSGAEETFVY